MFFKCTACKSTSDGRILGVGNTEMGPKENFGCGTLQILNCLPPPNPPPPPQEGPYKNDTKKYISLWLVYDILWLQCD